MRTLVLLLLSVVGLSVAAAQPATVAKGSHVNLRADKAEGARILRVLPPDTPVEVLEEEGQYARVRLASGETGWLARRFLVMESAPVAAPAEPVPTAAPTPAPSPPPPAAGNDASWALFAAGGAGFLLGALVGVSAHEAYYRKRLKGLRI